MIPPLQEYIDRADELAQEVVNAWAANIMAGNSAHMTSEFRAVFEKACAYRSVRQVTDQMGHSEALETKEARKEFAEAFRAWEQKQSRKMPT
jgi:hypothetical protein